MTIIAGLFASVFGRLLGRRKGALAAAVGMGVYKALVGRMRPWCGRPSSAGWGFSHHRSGGASTAGGRPAPGGERLRPGQPAGVDRQAAPGGGAAQRLCRKPSRLAGCGDAKGVGRLQPFTDGPEWVDRDYDGCGWR